DVRPHTQVAILLDRSIELVLAELAVLKCGAAYVPLDRNAPPARQALMIEDCRADIVLTMEESELPAKNGMKCFGIHALMLEDPREHNLAIPLKSEAPAYIMYTSGSTGGPKGVTVPHCAVGRLVLNCGYVDFNAGDRVAFAANPAFDASTMEVWAP